MPFSYFPEGKAEKPVIDIGEVGNLFVPSERIKAPPFRKPVHKLKIFT
jgi:hypothetical protein